jgi:hypothetical protein
MKSTQSVNVKRRKGHILNQTVSAGVDQQSHVRPDLFLALLRSYQMESRKV